MNRTSHTEILSSADHVPVKNLYPVVVSVGDNNLPHGVDRHARHAVELTTFLAVRTKGRDESAVHVEHLYPEQKIGKHNSMSLAMTAVSEFEVTESGAAFTSHLAVSSSQTAPLLPTQI